MSASPVAAIAVVVGVLGLVVCAALLSQSLPDSFPRWYRRNRVELPTNVRRRVVTGPSAAERLDVERRPARHPALRPDVLRRERERLGALESRRIIEEMADDEPERLAAVVGALLAADDRDDDTRGTRTTSRGRRRGTG